MTPSTPRMAARSSATQEDDFAISAVDVAHHIAHRMQLFVPIVANERWRRLRGGWRHAARALSAASCA